ncbi:MAG: hypothetical protein P8Z36_08750 [Gemmatimonadota bacterium]|jgi:hypothetical protein
MMAFVGIQPPTGHSEGIQAVPDLPESPATRFSGFLVRSEHESNLARTLAWYRDVVDQRPGVPLGIVYSPNVCLAMLGECAHPIRPIIPTDNLVAGAPPMAVVEQLREASVEGRIMQELVAEFGGSILVEKRILTALIAYGVGGGLVASAAHELKCSQEKIRLHLAEFGIQPGRLMSRVRLRAYDLRKQLGVQTRQALDAGGWHTSEARRKVARRQKNGR